MVRRKNNLKIIEEIGGTRKQVENTNDSFSDNNIDSIQDILQKSISYIEDQANNLKSYAIALQQLCHNNECRSYLDFQIEELNAIKVGLDKSLTGTIYPVDEPRLNPIGYTAHFFRFSCPVFGDLMSRLIRVHKALESIHDGLLG